MRQGDLFSSRLDLIRDVVRYTCRRYCLSSEEAADFASHVNLKLMDQDCAVLRKFQGKSSERTYLGTVIQRLYHDYRIEQWGKWRPSTRAKRLGPVAVLMERLLVKEQFTTDQAIEILRTNHGVDLSPKELGLIAEKLPVRTKRRFVGEEHLENLGAEEPAPDARLIEHENRGREKEIMEVLNRVKSCLSAEDQVILKMHYEDNFTIAEIARILKHDQAQLYRRLRKNLKRLGEAMEREGVPRRDIAKILAE